jgi:hypothetical protein
MTTITSSFFGQIMNEEAYGKDTTASKMKIK